MRFLARNRAWFQLSLSQMHMGCIALTDIREMGPTLLLNKNSLWEIFKDFFVSISVLLEFERTGHRHFIFDSKHTTAVPFKYVAEYCEL